MPRKWPKPIKGLALHATPVALTLRCTPRYRTAGCEDTLANMRDQIDTLLTEDRRFRPSPEFVAQANGTRATYEDGARDRIGFWEAQARQLDWIRPWSKALEWTPPHARSV